MSYIILADDDPLLGELVRFKLEAAGHRVDIVTDGHRTPRVAEDIDRRGQ